MARERDLRQKRILDLLGKSAEPVRGDDLAAECHVTRQVVVHEIALLRAQGVPLVATPRGYYLAADSDKTHQAILSVRHTPVQTRDELYTLVDHGVIVHNVTVEHPLYGELTGTLHLRSRIDVDQFLEQVAQTRTTLLSMLTDGFHMHSVEFKQNRDLERAIDALRAQNIQVFS